MKDKIVCLVGASGTGKTSVAKILCDIYDANMIHSYTTRPPRYSDEWGHIFVDRIPVEHRDNMIGYCQYDHHEYWATKDQYKDKGKSIYIVEPTGVGTLKNEVLDADIVVFYLVADEQERLRRLVTERSTTEAMYRVEKDRGRFEIVPCHYCIDTNFYPPARVAALVTALW